MDILKKIFSGAVGSGSILVSCFFLFLGFSFFSRGRLSRLIKEMKDSEMKDSILFLFSNYFSNEKYIFLIDVDQIFFMMLIIKFIRKSNVTIEKSNENHS